MVFEQEIPSGFYLSLSGIRFVQFLKTNFHKWMVSPVGLLGLVGERELNRPIGNRVVGKRGEICSREKHAGKLKETYGRL